MSIHTLSNVLLGSALLHYLVLLIWFGALVGAHDALYRLHTRWFRLSLERFDAIHYAGMAVYKIGVLLLFLIPGIALRIWG